MRLTPEQVRDRAIDYLYEELSEEERTAFEAHLAESAEARRELSELRETLGLARDVLRRGLEEPPARVRVALLAAAQAAARERTKPERGRVSSLLRTPWLYPALGVAAAIAIVLVRREDVERGELTVRVPARTPAALPEPPALPAPASAEAKGASTGEHVAESSGTAAAPDARRAAASGGTTRRREVEPARRYAEPPAGYERRANLEQPGNVDEGAGPKRAATRGSAPPPSPSPSPLASAAESAGRGAGAADVASEPVAPASAAKARASESSKEGSSRTVSRTVSRTLDELERAARAQRDAGRVREARASYRELVRRFPNDRRAEAWRRELLAIERALRDAQ